MKVLILGGYGTFGGRLADLLADEPRLTLYIAGRNFKAAERFCRQCQAQAKLVPVALDRANPAAQLDQLRPELVVDASGPFQDYGADPYAFGRAVLAAGADYLDLSDGADFVAGITALDAEAKANGRFVLSGISSFPVLTAAVVRKLAAGLDHLDTITAGIAPSPYAGVGYNVIRAIASYAGQPVKVWKDSRWTTLPGFFDSRHATIAVPGCKPLQRRRFALAEVPDLQVLTWDWPQVRSVWIGAGPTPALLHRLLWLAAGLVHLKILPSLKPLAPIMNWVVNTVRWGDHRGGMFVEITGRRGTNAVRRRWMMLAEGDGGPRIPSMGAEAIIRRCLNGHRPEPGARPGHRDLELEDYLPLFARQGITSGFPEETTS